MEFIGLIWNEGILRPMINTLVLIYAFLWHNFGVTILAFTVVVRLLTMPLTLRQMRQTRAMSGLQSSIQQIKRRFPNDRQRQSQEQMRLFKEHGVNPIGCLGPMLLQFPIWIGLYQSIIHALPTAPENLMELSQKFYGWLPAVHSVVPLNSQFLGMNLSLAPSAPGSGALAIALPVFVGASMWTMQKMMTLPTTDPTTQRTNQTMLWMMPIFIGFISFQFPSGLGLYIFVSNLIGMAIQYPVTGWGSLIPSKAAQQPATITAATPPDKEEVQHGEGEQPRGDRQERRGGNRTGAKRARRRSRRGGSRGS